MNTITKQLQKHPVTVPLPREFSPTTRIGDFVTIDAFDGAYISRVIDAGYGEMTLEYVCTVAQYAASWLLATVASGGDDDEAEERHVTLIEEDEDGNWTITETTEPKSAFDAAYFDSLHFDDWRESHAAQMLEMEFDASADDAHDDAAYRLFAMEVAA